ncbi:MAG: rod shape-determining protein MreC [Bacteroidia bacterium]|jgi:rod shape-determining protein MreC
MSSDITGYFGLRAENDRLSSENAKLRDQLYRIGMSPKIQAISDSTHRLKYDLFEAEVINNSVNRRNNHLTLDRGMLDGVQPEMGVMGPNGLVGIVQDVSKRYASVMSILHQKTSISARLEGTGYFGSISWNGENNRVAQLLDIPSHVRLSKGQVLVTSGHSTIFPPNLRIGTIRDFDVEPGDNFYKVNIDLSEDLAAVRNVYLITNLERMQQQTLEQQTENDD